MRSKLTAFAMAVFALIATVRPMSAQAFNNPVNTSGTAASPFSQLNQHFANAFTLAGFTPINSVEWYGTMFSPDPLNTGDTWDFNLFFLNPDLSLRASVSVTADVTDTGIDLSLVPNGPERLYRFSASFSDIGFGGATQYYLSIINRGTQDTFRWARSTGTGPSAFSVDGNTWTPLSDPDVTPFNFVLNPAAAVSTTPEPATISLFAIGMVPLMVAARRKRSA